MSESVAPDVDLETESDIDPGTEMPYQEASAVNIEEDEQDDNSEMSDQDEDSQESDEDKNKEMSEEEKKEEEKWKKRERDYFTLKLVPEPPDERPLVGRELLRELELHKKMRCQALLEIKNLRNVPYIKHLMRAVMSNATLEDLQASEIDIQGAFMPHPYPL